MTLESTKLLTIAIPTYNRSEYLSLCLSQICRQLDPVGDKVDVIVSDNCSTDNTREVVGKYIENGYNIKYVRNETNLGADGNIVQCYNVSNSKYVLVFGDDDILLDESLGKIISILQGNDFGIVYLNSFVFSNDYILEMPQSTDNQLKVFKQHDEFIERVHYWLTFISGNIVNITHISKEIDSNFFYGTNLAQMSYILPALFNAEQNAVAEEYLLAVRGENSGGYRLCEVFGVNFNKIFDFFVLHGVDRKYFDVINNHLLRTFFPGFIFGLRNSKNDFVKEKYFAVLLKVYCKNINFWIYTMPMIILPIRLAKLWSMVSSRLLKYV